MFVLPCSLVAGGGFVENDSHLGSVSSSEVDSDVFDKVTLTPFFLDKEPFQLLSYIFILAKCHLQKSNMKKVEEVVRFLLGKGPLELISYLVLHS